MAELVMASASPRRQALLHQIGLSFRVVAPRVAENLDEEKDVGQEVQRVAKAKAWFVAGPLQAGLVLAADTVVVHRSQTLGKPYSTEAARAMLVRLQGEWHRVTTGVALVDAVSGIVRTGQETTEVKMAMFSRRVIDCYVATGEPLDKAGAYGIQGKGALLVEGIRGCYFNVVGLPLGLVSRLLAQGGLDVWEEFIVKG